MANQKTIKEKIMNKREQLLLDADAITVNIFCRLNKLSIPKLYELMMEHLESNNITQSPSTFRNILLDSNTIKNRPTDVVLRAKTMSVILDYIDLNKTIKSLRDRIDEKRQEAMKLQIKIDSGRYDDIPAYTNEEILLHTSESLPDNRNISEMGRLEFDTDKIISKVV